ncbi:MAG: hypothetical protein KC492_35520, partial [Myxococcales bacterium]|nr:hypothetical protein [Myxococcales bacterium]
MQRAARMRCPDALPRRFCVAKGRLASSSGDTGMATPENAWRLEPRANTHIGGQRGSDLREALASGGLNEADRGYSRVELFQ